MIPSPEPPFDSQPKGISLDELAQAFAEVMGVESRVAEAGEATSSEVAAVTEEAAETPSEPLAEPSEADDTCPICPRTILEAMLFVGNRDNRPLSPRQAAELMRDVTTDEIPPLVAELNRRYAAVGAPYHIVGEGDGYRLTLRREYGALRDRFFGRIREARLSQAAVDVLALVAYQQPISAEQIAKLRGHPSNHVLSHLVRRGLLRIERPEGRRAAFYHTTDRFLRLFNLDSLDDLPRSEDAEPT